MSKTEQLRQALGQGQATAHQLAAKTGIPHSRVMPLLSFDIGKGRISYNKGQYKLINQEAVRIQRAAEFLRSRWFSVEKVA